MGPWFAACSLQPAAQCKEPANSAVRVWQREHLGAASCMSRRTPVISLRVTGTAGQLQNVLVSPATIVQVTGEASLGISGILVPQENALSGQPGTHS